MSLLSVSYYKSDVTVTNISQSLSRIMAGIDMVGRNYVTVTLCIGSLERSCPSQVTCCFIVVHIAKQSKNSLDDKPKSAYTIGYRLYHSRKLERHVKNTRSNLQVRRLLTQQLT